MRALRDLLRAYFAEVANAQADVLLTVVYWSAVAGSAIVMRLAGRRLLDREGRPRWAPRAPFRSDRDAMRRQY